MIGYIPITHISEFLRKNIVIQSDRKQNKMLKFLIFIFQLDFKLITGVYNWNQNTVDPMMFIFRCLLGFSDKKSSVKKVCSRWPFIVVMIEYSHINVFHCSFFLQKSKYDWGLKRTRIAWCRSAKCRERQHTTTMKKLFVAAAVG